MVYTVDRAGSICQEPKHCWTRFHCDGRKVRHPTSPEAHEFVSLRDAVLGPVGTKRPLRGQGYLELGIRKFASYDNVHLQHGLRWQVIDEFAHQSETSRHVPADLLKTFQDDLARLFNREVGDQLVDGLKWILGVGRIYSSSGVSDGSQMLVLRELSRRLASLNPKVRPVGSKVCCDQCLHQRSNLGWSRSVRGYAQLLEQGVSEFDRHLVVLVAGVRPTASIAAELSDERSGHLYIVSFNVLPRFMAAGTSRCQLSVPGWSVTRRMVR